MADFGSPVAQNVDINPQKSLQTLADVVNIKRNQQALQTGQYTQQSAQANSQQDQQKNTELQNLAAYTKSAVDDPSMKMPDGATLNVNKFQQGAMKVAPVYGLAAIGQATTNANEAIQNQKALLGLSQDRRKVIGDMTTSWASNPNVSGTQVIDDIEKTRQEFRDDPEVSRFLTSLTGGAPLTQDSKSIQQWAANGAARIGGLSQSKDTENAAGQKQRENAFTGERSLPELSGGATNPTAPQVAGQTSRQTGSANIDLDRATQIGNAQQGASAIIDRTKRIDQLSEAVNSSSLAKKFQEAGGYLGFRSLDQARTELVKDLAQLKGPVAAMAGSDQRAQALLEGYPTDSTPPRTTHTAMDYFRGTARQTQASGRLLDQYPTQDRAGFAAADNLMKRTTDPLTHEYLALSPTEQPGFLNRNFATKDQRQDFIDHIGAVKKHSKVLDENK